MVFFMWDAAKYSVGIKEIDAQHKVLVDMLNELFEAMQAGHAKEAMSKIIFQLASYTRTHFATEEKYMEKFGYPEMSSHKIEHAKFVDQVNQFKDDFDAGKLSVSINVTSFLKDWLIKHISGTDKRYTSFFNSKGLV